MNRKEGYYWVKYKGIPDIGYWYPEKKVWDLCRYMLSKADWELDEINETQILPPSKLMS